jgi:sugar lactone lactonase YvrE
MTETFATGLRMGESPRWHDGRFWMCDWLAGEVLVFDAYGQREVVARVEGLPFSIDWLPDGQLVVTTPGGVRIGPELRPYGGIGEPFNEIVVDAVGRVWVDMPGSMPWEEPKPGTARTRQGRSGTPAFRVSAVNGSPKAARCWRPSARTAVASRACSAVTTAAPCT